MTLDELAASLPSGLHDAKLFSFAIDVLPMVPSGAFLAWIFVYEWNAFLRVVARDVQIEEPPRVGDTVTPP